MQQQRELEMRGNTFSDHGKLRKLPDLVVVEEPQHGLAVRCGGA
jgi:hypothetical protein